MDKFDPKKRKRIKERLDKLESRINSSLLGADGNHRRNKLASDIRVMTLDESRVWYSRDIPLHEIEDHLLRRNAWLHHYEKKVLHPDSYHDALLLQLVRESEKAAKAEEKRSRREEVEGTLELPAQIRCPVIGKTLRATVSIPVGALRLALGL